MFSPGHGLKIMNENPKNEKFLWFNLWIFLSGVNISHHPASFIPEAEHSLCPKYLDCGALYTTPVNQQTGFSPIIPIIIVS